MDNKQLITIAVTAVISVIAKEVLSWVVAAVRATATAATMSAKVKMMFTKNNLDIAFHLFIIVFYMYAAAYVGWTDAPLSGKEMMIVIGCIFAASVMALSLLIKIASMLTQHKGR